MEHFSNLGMGSSARSNNSRVSMFYMPSAASPSTATATTTATPSTSVLSPQAVCAGLPPPGLNVDLYSCSVGGACPYPHPEKGEPLSRGEMETLKAKIMSHPQYAALLTAYLDCQKVGAPPDVVGRLTVISTEVSSRKQMEPPLHADPELDQFMEAYCGMLAKCKDELTRPIQEAMDFLKNVEAQFTSLSNCTSSAPLAPSDGKSDGVCSSEDDQNSGDYENENSGIDPRADDKELKHQLLKKYSGYISSLRQEFSKRKKRGKLPKEARQKLLSWWELHYKWPYPSETEKTILAESTGLDQKQINNWFINQRKRHWKPSEEMQYVVMDSFYNPPHNAAAAAAPLYMEPSFLGEGMYRLGS